MASSGFSISSSRQRQSNFCISGNSIYSCSTRSIVTVAALIFTSTGSRRKDSASSLIGAGMVAEKNIVCLSSGIPAKIVRISSINPISTISSPSSRTRIWTWDRSMVPLFIWSIRRPGVATIIFGFLRSARNCLSISCPP